MRGICRSTEGGGVWGERRIHWSPGYRGEMRVQGICGSTTGGHEGKE